MAAVVVDSSDGNGNSGSSSVVGSGRHPRGGGAVDGPNVDDDDGNRPRRPWLSGIPTPFPLHRKTPISSDTDLYEFALPSDDLSLGLSTCSCILVSPPPPPKSDENDDDDSNSNKKIKLELTRPYTPISSVSTKGSFTLLVKRYPEGPMSQVFGALNVGNKLFFRQIPKNIKIQYPFEHPKCLLLLAAGTGITPIYQAMQRLFGNSLEGSRREDDGDGPLPRVVLCFGCRTREEIYLRSELEDMKRRHPDRIRLIYFISDEEEPPPTSSSATSSSVHEDGKNNGDDDEADKNRNKRKETPDAHLSEFHYCMMNEDILTRLCHGEEKTNELLEVEKDGSTPPKIRVFVCGPPGFYKFLCGPREDETNVTGVLQRLGFGTRHVVKF